MDGLSIYFLPYDCFARIFIWSCWFVQVYGICLPGFFALMFALLLRTLIPHLRFCSFTCVEPSLSRLEMPGRKETVSTNCGTLYSQTTSIHIRRRPPSAYFFAIYADVKRNFCDYLQSWICGKDEAIVLAVVVVVLLGFGQGNGLCA
jgi:hypothetical protein